MEPESSLPRSQEPATGLYSEPHASNPYLPTILSSHLCLDFPSGLFPSSFPTKILYIFLIAPMRATFPIHLTFLDLITLRRFSEVYNLQSSSLCSLPHSPATSSLLGPNILLSFLFLNIFNLCPCPSLRDQVSYLYKPTGQIMVLYILNFVFQKRDGKTKYSKQKSNNLSRISSALNFFVNVIVTCQCFSKLLKLCHIFKGFISNQYIVILSYVTTIHLVLCIHLCTNLSIACNSLFVFIYGICVFTRYINIVSIDQELICSIQVQSFLIFFAFPNGISFSKSKFKSNGNKASCFTPF